MDVSIFFGLGLLLGLKHAFDIDHVVTVNNLLSESKNVFTSSIITFFWGLGHSLVLFLVGLLVLLFNITISEFTSLSFEFLVAMILIFLGFSSFHRRTEKRIERFKSYKKSFGIGLVHGLAGSSALMILLLPKISSVLDGLLYIGVFGIGSIIGMLMVGVFMYLIYSLKFFEKINLVKISGVFSIMVGTFLIYEIGISQGLFFMF